MPVDEDKYKFIQELFCDYLKINKKDPLEKALYTKYTDLDITQDDIKNNVVNEITGVEGLPTLKDKFLNLFKFKKKHKTPTKEEKEEENLNKVLNNLDIKILGLLEEFKTPITPINEITKDTKLLDKDFDLILNIRKKAGFHEENDDLDIYKSYLDTLLNINENILEPFGFYIANNLFEKNNYKKNKEYYKYIIICAITSRFIALYNKKILLKQLEDLLRDITKTLYKCYNRTTSSAVDAKASAIEGFKKIKTSVGDSIFRTPDTSYTNNNQIGGLLYLNTDPEMKKTEGSIIMLNNLFQSNDLTVKSLTQEYNATPYSKVSWLIDILFASGIVLSGGLLGVFASGATNLALTIGNSTLCGITGGVWTFSRDEILKSYHFSTDLDDTLKILKKQFNLHYNDLDTNKKIKDCPSITETNLKPVYKDIDNKIKNFSDKVMVSYQKYLDIFEFIVKSRENILGKKYCDKPEIIVLSEKDIEFKQIWLPILEDILNNWPTTTGTNIIRAYTKTREQNFNDFFKAIGINCSKPSKKKILSDAIDDINRMSGEDLIKSLKVRFLCKDEELAQQKPNGIGSTSIGGNRKTKRLIKRKNKKILGKGKTYKRK